MKPGYGFPRCGSRKPRRADQKEAESALHQCGNPEGTVSGNSTKAKSGKRHEARQQRRILLLDDHRILRQGLKEIINRERDLMVCGEAGEARSALEMVDKADPDLVLVDISLPGPNGIEFIKNLHSKNSRVPVAVLSMHDESLYAERALRAGALAYISKTDSAEKVLTGIRAALKGNFHVSSTVGENIFFKFLGRKKSVRPGINDLSDRELEVFELIGRGQARAEIAASLKVSPKTVDSYQEHIKRKLALTSGREVISQAHRWMEQISDQSTEA